MFNSDLIKEIVSTIKYNKIRTLLTAFGVFLGIFMLVLLVGAGNGLTQGVQNTFSGFATNSAFMGAGRTTIPYAGYQRGRSWDLTTDDADVIRQSVPGVEYVLPRLIGSWNGGGANNTVRNNHVGTFNIYGDYSEYREVDKVKILQGRWLNVMDIKEARKVCVIGEKVLATLFDKDENPVGEYIRISGIYYQVIGVFSPISQSINFGGSKEEAIEIPITTMQRMYNYGNKAHMMCITAQKNYLVSDVEKKAKDIIRRRHKIAPDDEQALWSFNIQKMLQKFLRLFSSISLITLVVGAGTLLSGIIGVGNIMLVAVKERTKTIGIQRAIGATPKQVVLPILYESIIITSLSGFVGLSMGVFLLELIRAVLKNNDVGAFLTKFMQIDIKVAVGALIILILGGILAGALPAQRALRINPVDALRDE